MSPFSLRTLLCTACLCGLALAGGCARYEYDIVEPSDLAQPVGRRETVSVPVEPLRYEMRTVESRLVVFVYNPTGEPVKLLGEDSFAVDPDGQSHTLPTRTIAPDSSTKLILPPLRPRLRSTGPTFGFGVGVGVSSLHRRGYPYGRAGYYDDDFPRYYAIEDDGTTYWEWEGETDVRLRLVYEQGGKRFDHAFLIHRRRV